jgi:hypothetical protein
MAISEISKLEKSDLNAFLFSDVGQERSGMTMSVVSLIARMGADPWREAGRLAGLPQDAAREWLAQTIASTPSSTWSLPDATVIATRLVALLPSRTAERIIPVPAAWRDRLPVQKVLVPLGFAALGAAIVIALTQMGMR